MSFLFCVSVTKHIKTYRTGLLYYYLPSQNIVEKAHDRIFEITKKEERIICYRRNLDLVEKFKKIVQ